MSYKQPIKHLVLRHCFGTVVVEYACDAWGKPISINGSMASALRQDNPFRYRVY